MSEREEKRQATPVEGVRIIGAEEAQAAVESGAVAPRRPDDEPRYGDVPASPAGPRPPLRFPLAGDEDPAEVPRPAVNPPSAGPGFAGGDLPHWTEPPTGEHPRILVDDEEEDDGSWTAPSSGPRWREEGPTDWDDVDTHDPSEWADDEAPLGALDDTDRPGGNDMFSFDNEVDEIDLDEPAPPVARPRARTARPPTAPAPATGGGAGGGGRDVGTAVTTGVIVAAALLLALKVFENAGGAVFATVVLGLASVEMFSALRQRGFRPATLLGIVGTVALSWAAYERGEQAFPLVMSLFVMFTMLWYLLGVVQSQPVGNIGASLLGFAYVGFLGAHAALLLRFDDGVGMLLGAVIATVGYDVGGYFIGSQFGRTPLATASPNKTVEGLLGGMTGAIVASLIVLNFIGVHPWDGGSALALGLVVAIAAPLGDLCESLIKRDLGIKDMGSILPGHGGVLDRIDALLFVIPATYYLVKLLEIYTR